MDEFDKWLREAYASTWPDWSDDANMLARAAFLAQSGRVAELEGDLVDCREHSTGLHGMLEEERRVYADALRESASQTSELQTQLDRATSESARREEHTERCEDELDWWRKSHCDDRPPADIWEGAARDRKPAEPRPVDGRYMADDGDGEREEFGTLSEAHEWADEQVTAYRLAAMADGEWPGEVNDVAVWQAIESTREFGEGEGSDFVLEPCAVAAQEPRPVDEHSIQLHSATRTDMNIEAAAQQADTQEPRPMSEAPQDGTPIRLVYPSLWSGSTWMLGAPLGWLPATSDEEVRK